MPAAAGSWLAAGVKQCLDLFGVPVLSFVAARLMARPLVIMVATAGGIWLFLEHPAALSVAIVWWVAHLPRAVGWLVGVS
jgi:hypothetical protein